MISEYTLFHTKPNEMFRRFIKKIRIKTCTNPLTRLHDCEYQEKHNDFTNPIILPVKLKTLTV